MKNVLFAFLMLATVSVFAQGKPDAWTEFAKTKYEPKYLEKIGEYQYFPTFTPEVKALVGKEVSIEGFYVPFAPENGNYIILSKLPMSQCFFCGVGGPETIIEVNFKGAIPKFNNDDFLTVKGKLKLNADDIEHMNFILTDAVVVKK
jgi:uncharacterized membrane protein YcgQ (UPF0703/DUF1980 family)